jgi:hypothetical protein
MGNYFFELICLLCHGAKIILFVILKDLGIGIVEGINVKLKTGTVFIKK